MMLRMKKALTSVCLVFLMIAATGSQNATTSTSTMTEPLTSATPITTSSQTNASTPFTVTQLQTTSFTTATTSELQSTTDQTSTSSESQVITGTTSSTSESQETTEPTFTSSESQVSAGTTSTLSETQVATRTTFTSSGPQMTSGTTSTFANPQVTNSATAPLTTYPSTNSTTSSTTYPTTNSSTTASWTPFPATNSTTAFSMTYPTSNSTTTIYSTEAQTNYTILSTNETKYNYISATSTTYTDSTTLSVTTYPTTNSTTTSSTTYPTTNSTTSSTTYPTTNSTTSSTTYPATNSTTTSWTTYPASNSTSTSSTTYPSTNSTSTSSTTYPATNSTSASSTTYPATNSTTTSSTTYPITNSTSTSSTTYPATNSTTTSSTTNPATNFTSTSSTIYPITNSTSTSSTTYSSTNSVTTSPTTYTITNSTTTSSTTYPTTNSTTTSSTTNPATNFTSTSSTTYPVTNSTSTSPTTYPITNFTSTSSTTYSSTNSITTSPTTYTITNSTTTSSTTYPATNSITTSWTTYLTTNSTTTYSTTYPATNSTATSSTTYPTTNSTTSSTTYPTTNSTTSSTTYPATNSTTTSWTTYPATNFTSTSSTTYPASNSTSTSSTTYPASNSTSASSTTYPATNSTPTSSTTYPITNSTSTSSTTYPATNFTATSSTTYPITNSTTTSSTTYPITNSTSTSSTIYPATNSTTTSSTTYPTTNSTTTSTTTTPATNFTSTSSTTYPVTNSTSTSPTTYPITNSTSTSSTTYPATNSITTSPTTYPTTNSTTTSSTTYPVTNPTSTFPATHPATNSTTTSLTTYPTTNSTTTSSTTYPASNSTSTSSTTYPASNSTSASSTTYPITNSTITSSTTYPATNSTTTSPTIYPITNSTTTSSTTYPATMSITTSWTTYPTTNSTSTSSTTYPVTNSTSTFPATYPAMNSTSTSSTTNPATNSTTTSSTTYPASNSTTTSSTTYEITNSATTSSTYPTTNSISTSSTTYPTTNSTSTSSTTYPATNSTTTSWTTYPVTNYSTTTSLTTNPITNSTSTSSTTYPITNSTTTSSTGIRMTTISVPEGVAFEYGTDKGDSVFTDIDDACIPEVRSSLQFPIYGVFYSTMYICSNGIVSFDERITTPGPPWDDIQLQSQGSYLAPYFNDLDLRGYWSSRVGVIYYHVYDIIEDNNLKNNSNVIKARDYVRKYETDQRNFSPTFLLVVTWENASPYPVFYRRSESVSFQLALATDGLNTFVAYIYFAGQMRLNYNYIFIGYSFVNSGILKKDVNSFTTGALRMDSNAVTNGIRGVLYYRLTPVGFQVSSEERVCRAWWSENRYWRSYNSWMNIIMPWCPCTLNLLWWDSSFGSYYFENSNIYCAVVQPRWWYSPHGKTCCYNIRTGQYQQTAPNAGGFLQYHKTLYPRQYQAVDQRMKEYCCSRTNLCHLYYELRPVSWCYSSFPFFFAFFWGDPHIETLDKKKFTFNGWGEYTLVSLETANTTFILQSRTSRATKTDGNYTHATIFSAFAAKDNLGANIHVELNETKDGLIIYAKSNENASSFDDFTIDFADMSKEFNVQDEYLSMSRDDASKTFTAVFSSGISLNISVGVQMLSVSVVLPTEFKGQPKGLLGNFDENPDNDFICPNGTELASNISERQIFNYGQTWEVYESVFRYSRGKNHSDFQHNDFIPKFLDDPQVDQAKVNKSKQSCGEANQECIFDLVFTENEAVANNTRNIENRALKGQSELENEVPQIFGNSTVYAYVGNNVMVNVNGSDDGSFSFTFLENTANASVRLINNNTGIVSFFLNNTNPVSVSVTVEDNHGVQAPALDLTILVCSGCSGHGNCKFTQEREDNRSTTHFKYVTCSCSPYWEGDDCEIDLDGCATRPCSSLRNCTDNPAEVHQMWNQTYNCSSCPSGYMDGMEDPAKCIDINECNATHGCNQTCVNTEGSYYCTCNSTFRLHSNGKDCQDIDECKEGTSGCDQECNNTYGGYFCGCKYGYMYNNTRRACVKGNDTICQLKNCSGAHGCTINETNQEICFCRSGYQLIAKDLCEDVDECRQKICSQDCENVAGGFHCKCLQGYTLGSDKTSCIACAYPYYGYNCSNACTCGTGAIRCDPLRGCVCQSGWTGTSCNQDVDECSQNPNICNNTLKICMNAMGSYTCSCVSGYQATHNTCTDVNECADPTLNTCEKRCINTLGGFTCGCESGYNTDPDNSTKCIDIDECKAGQSGCQQSCENSPGRFSCSCYFGYDLIEDRKTCKEVENPCKNANLTCDQICLVDLQAKTAACSCNLGFKLATNNITCEDINECTGNGTLINCSSNAICQNTNGSYVCSCNVGFKLENDGRTCSECDSFHYGTNCSIDCNCSVGTQRCDKVTGCVCKRGWDGDKCDTDMDECSNKTLCKGANIYCLNTPGSYQCLCESGYKKINDSCIDIDECSDHTAFCTYACKNTNGSYECICMSGFKVNGSYCADVDECLRSEDDCAQGCQNTEGSYECVCYSGYEVNGTTCTPIPGQNMTSIGITFTFDIQVNGSLSMIDTYDKYLFNVNHTLYNYFYQKMGDYFISIEKITLQKGSLIAIFILLMQDSTAGKTSLVNYLTDALNEQFVIDGINVTLQSLAVGSYTVSSSGGLCVMYESLVGTCPRGYKCTVNGGRPSCGPVDKEEDNKALVIGLSVGIPLGVILIAVVIILVLKCKHNTIKDVTMFGGRWSNMEMHYPIGADREQSGHSCNLLGFKPNNLEFESGGNEGTNSTQGKSWPLTEAEV